MAKKFSWQQWEWQQAAKRQAEWEKDVAQKIGR